MSILQHLSPAFQSDAPTQGLQQQAPPLAQGPPWQKTHSTQNLQKDNHSSSRRPNTVQVQVPTYQPNKGLHVGRADKDCNWRTRSTVLRTNCVSLQPRRTHQASQRLEGPAASGTSITRERGRVGERQTSRGDKSKHEGDRTPAPGTSGELQQAKSTQPDFSGPEGSREAGPNTPQTEAASSTVDTRDVSHPSRGEDSTHKPKE